ncbi:hypothetical protein SEA_VANLEE_137 [Gordonia phage VanLee]|uniref:Uncharacterized protein n=1 Tax=Gordonia phage VanLee TaxID=2845816 RepID=A0A8F2IFG0_9CAUD|nr:hypothetical protein QEH49_gp153 [Gordonia phage VanLee]QWS68253.1 hypothetical protein SEA_VANLEE_137 [Gordonia phage VanLee]
MILTITCPEGRMAEYAEQVAAQLAEGYTQGHVDRNTHWEIVDDVANDPESLGEILGRMF